ncbi:MAG: hypothetical protein ACE14W_02990 [Candidatus Velamenicoccus archaeovorus]
MLIKRREGHDGAPGRTGKRRGSPPVGEEAYESNWYRVLARMAESDEDTAPWRPTAGNGPMGSIGGSRQEPSTDGDGAPSPGPVPVEEQELELGPAPVELDEAPDLDDRLLHITGPTPPARAPKAQSKEGSTPYAKGSAPAVERPRVIHSTVRIGVRKAADPEDVYVAYLTSSPHADYFRSDWWPGGRSLTPVHLWRANHLGAGWDVGSVRRFMAGPAAQAERLLEGAPRRDAPGTPARRMWFRRLVEQDWVQELGVPRVCKTLHPLVPELVPSLDPDMTPWARTEWLGLRGEAQDHVEIWTDVWELLEDTLVLRGDVLADVVRSTRERAPGRAPVGRFGLIGSLFWDSYWKEALVAEVAAPPAPRRRLPARGSAREGASDARAASRPSSRSRKASSATPAGRERGTRTSGRARGAPKTSTGKGSAAEAPVPPEPKRRTRKA